MKLDFNLLFDGKPPKEFLVALNRVRKGKAKPDLEIRKKILDLQLLSNFLSGEAARFGLPAFEGFLGDPKGASRNAYTAPGSVPDIEITKKDLVALVGPQLASEFVDQPGGGQAQESVALELKQTATTKKGKESLTQIGGKAFASEIESLDKALKTIGASKYSSSAILDWFNNQAPKAFRERVLAQIEEKIGNVLLISYVDEKGNVSPRPIISVVPGAAKKLNLRSQANQRKFLAPELRGGSISFRLNPTGVKFIESQAVNITQQATRQLNKNFAQNFLNFYLNPRLGGSAIKKAQLQSRFTLVNAFAELIILAGQFDPSFGGKTFTFRQEIDTSRPGAVSSKAKGATKRSSTKSPQQQVISVAQLTELARKAFVQRMPRGNPNGTPPPVDNILTYRSGRFAKSFEIVTIDERNKRIRYTYDPIYRVHEATSRNPRTLIESGIRRVAQQKFGTAFRFIRQ
jgi:hypothetical protein